MGKRVRKSAKAKKADKVLNDASKRLHTDHDIFEMAKADADRMYKASREWQRGYYGSPQWKADHPKRTWYVQAAPQDDSLVRTGFSITFAAIILIVTKMLFF